MILKVVVPPYDAAFRAGYVARWFKQEGDPVEFGDPLCDIAIDHFMALQRTKRASLLSSSKKLRQRRVGDQYDRREGRGLVHMRIISSEASGTLGKILVAKDERIEIGDAVAILGTDLDAAGVDLAGLQEARIAIDMPKFEDVVSVDEE